MCKTQKRATGSTIAEAAAAMGLMLPLIFIILFVAVEIAQAYMIKETLTQGAREAARQMAIAYGQDNQIKDDRRMQNKFVFDNIRIANIINSSKQFKNPIWDTDSNPPTVSVTVSYTSGENGLPIFPTVDPLRIGEHFNLASRSVYRVE